MLFRLAFIGGKRHDCKVSAHGLEHASHSINEYTADNINNLVNKIIDSKIAEGVLNDAPVTFQEISTIKEVFKERLKAIYHTRISYPTEKK